MMVVGVWWVTGRVMMVLWWCRVCCIIVLRKLNCGQIIVSWNGWGVLICQSTHLTSEAAASTELWWYMSLCCSGTGSCCEMWNDDTHHPAHFTSPRHSHHLRSHLLSLPRPFTADLKLISFTNSLADWLTASMCYLYVWSCLVDYFQHNSRPSVFGKRHNVDTVLTSAKAAGDIEELLTHRPVMSTAEAWQTRVMCT